MLSVTLILPQPRHRFFPLVYTHRQLLPLAFLHLNDPLLQLIHHVLSLTLHPAELPSRLSSLLVVPVLLIYAYAVD